MNGDQFEQIDDRLVSGLRASTTAGLRFDACWFRVRCGRFARAGGATRTLPGVNFLLPQERSGTLRDVRAVEIHSDRYLDVWVEFDAPAGETRRARVPVSECPSDLLAGDRVSVRFVMGVMVKVARTTEPPPPPADGFTAPS